MTWKIVRVLEGRCLFGMRLHVKGRFSVKKLVDLILLTQPSAVCETAAKWIDSRARLLFRFFLNVFNCLLTTNLSRRNNRSRTGPQTLFNFRRNCNRQGIAIKFHAYSRYLAATRDVHSTTTGCKWLIVSFYDHDATQSECAQHLDPSGAWLRPRRCAHSDCVALW